MGRIRYIRVLQIEGVTQPDGGKIRHWLSCV